MADQEILTRSEVAAMLKLTVRTVDYLVSTNQIPFSRLGKRSVRFDRGRITGWFRDREGVEYRLNRNQAVEA